jgi:hypothetical protein
MENYIQDSGHFVTQLCAELTADISYGMRGHKDEGAGIMFSSSDDFRKVKVLKVCFHSLHCKFFREKHGDKTNYLR